MDPNTHSIGTTGELAGPAADQLAALGAAVEQLAGQDLDRLADAALAEQVLELRRLLDRLEGHWLNTLAAVDGRGAAGADQGQSAPSTAGWLRNRLRLGAGAAAGGVRTARALYRGPLAQTGQALTAGQLSPAHARVLASGTQELPAHITAEAEPVLLAAARRLDPPGLRRVVVHLCLVADPDGERDRDERRHGRRGLLLAPTWAAWSRWTGCWTPRPARPCCRRWSRWPVRPAPPKTAAHPSAGPTPAGGWPAMAT